MSRILLVSEIFPPKHGGSARWFYELYQRLDSHSVTIATAELDGNEIDFPHLIERSPMSSFEWGLINIKGLWFYLKQVWALRKLCKKHSIEQIHAGRILHEGFSAAWVSRLLGIKLVIFVHGEDIETTAVSREHDFMAKWAFKQAHSIIANSHNTASIMQRLNYATPSQIHVQHPGANIERYIPAEPDLTFKAKHHWDDRFVMLTVGRLQARKGQDFLIKALPSLIQSTPNLLYVVVGGGEESPTLKALVTQLQLEEHVQFKDAVDDDTLLQCYQQCDLFILPNRTIGNDIEGFGMVLVEAQACAKPVVAGNSGGTKETLIEGETGFIIDCTSPEALARDLLPILQREDLSQIGVAGQAFVSSTFNWPAHAAALSQQFDTLA